MKNTVLLAAISLICLFGMSGCGDGVTTLDPSSSADKQVGVSEMSQPPAPDTAGQTNVDVNATVVTINGATVTEGDLQQELRNMMAQYRQLPQQQLQQLMPSFRQQAQEALVNKILLIQEADKKNIGPSAEKIDSELKKIVDRFPSPEEYRQQLTALGSSEEALKEDIRKSLKINEIIENKLATITAVTDSDVAGFYKENPEQFKMPEQVRASHILVSVKPEDTQEIKDEKRKKLMELREQIQKGADFAKLAGDHSECASSAKGGDLGFFARGTMIKPFEDTAFGMKKGEISPVVETQFGYHLIKTVDRTAARVVPLEEAKEKIEAQLLDQKKQAAINELLEQLRNSATITYAQAG